MSEPVPLTRIVAQGRSCTVRFAVRANGNCPARDFYDEIAEIREKTDDDYEATAQARFLMLFQQMANFGHVSPKRFGKEPEEFSAFKHEVRNRQIRFACFRDGNDWIVTHGFIKPGAKKGRGPWPAKEIARAEEIAAEYRRRKAELEAKPKDKK